MPTRSPDPTGSYRQLLRRTLEGGSPSGELFDACRAVLVSDRTPDERFYALCTLLEGLLADPELPIADTNTLVQLLKDLARGDVATGDLL